MFGEKIDESSSDNISKKFTKLEDDKRDNACFANHQGSLNQTSNRPSLKFLYHDIKRDDQIS